MAEGNPTTEESRRHLSEWQRFLKREIQRAELDIATAEKLIKDTEDKLLVRGAIAALTGAGLGAVGALFPAGALVIAIGAAIVGSDPPVRILIWRAKKKELEQQLAESKSKLAALRRELEAVLRAWRVIEQRAFAPEPPALPERSQDSEEAALKPIPKKTKTKEDARAKRKRRR